MEGFLTEDEPPTPSLIKSKSVVLCEAQANASCCRRRPIRFECKYDHWEPLVHSLSTSRGKAPGRTVNSKVTILTRPRTTGDTVRSTSCSGSNLTLSDPRRSHDPVLPKRKWRFTGPAQGEGHTLEGGPETRAADPRACDRHHCSLRPPPPPPPPVPETSQQRAGEPGRRDLSGAPSRLGARQAEACGSR